ncbi:MAG: hypothetical protein R3D26_13495 [Cyanobacteriota/Melainabacteria group bacterium]
MFRWQAAARLEASFSIPKSVRFPNQAHSDLTSILYTKECAWFAILSNDAEARTTGGIDCFRLEQNPLSGKFHLFETRIKNLGTTIMKNHKKFGILVAMLFAAVCFSTSEARADHRHGQATSD